MMHCNGCEAEYQTNTKRTSGFRIFSSKQGSAPNRSPAYYTGPERKVKEVFEECGLEEGITFFHNSRIKSEKGYYFVDFILPIEKIIV